MIELKFKIDDKDLEAFKPNNLQAGRELDKAIKKMAFDVRNIAIKGISQGVRTGKIYKRRRIVHQASAPGEYPKTDTGRLVSSIRTDFRYLEADIGSDVNYSQYLEMGTKNMKPRPWLERSAETAKPQWHLYIEDALRKAFKL